MKRLIVLLFLVSIGLAGISQGLFKPVPKNYFSTKALGDNTSIIPRINVGVTGFSYGKNAETKQLEVIPLNAIVFGFALLHYKNTPEGPFNDFGIMPAYLQLVDKAGSGAGLYLTYNTGQIGLLNLGGHYDFAVNQFFFDVGVSWHY